MTLSPHERLVNDYYDAHTDEFYLVGWDPEYLHFGIFDEQRNAAYEADPGLVLRDRREAIVAMTSRIVDSAQIHQSDTVIDAGCGVGGASFYIAANVGASVVGLNINQNQLEIARGRAQEAGLADRVSFRFADCSQPLPFEDDSVDVVVNIESACHFGNRRGFILECARILKPGGRLVGQDWVADDGLSAGDIEEYIAPLCDAWVLGGVESMASYRILIEDAGLRLQMAEHMGPGMLPNGYIMRWGYEDILRREAERALSDDESTSKELFRTFSSALLSHRLKIGHYVAEKARGT
jgi:cyclopropane fatty-acyl-phospholipid synthase-like methyltransferase